MDKLWSEMNKEMQALIAKKATFKDGIGKLLELRKSLFEQITQIVTTFPEEAFWQMPFAGAEGYHSKTLAYSIWHIFRIEDIVAHEMIAEDQEEIVDFSKQLDVRALYRYAREVMESTNGILSSLEYPDLKRKFGADMVEKLGATGCVSGDESARWLIGYWCSKDVLGLVKMPFSRHWIMHIEAMQRIKNRLCKLARKGADPIAYCGFSCNHCFLSEWCGSCRTAYNVCAFATISPDGKCPNAVCCQEKGIDGCYECDNLESCEAGFYIPSNDGAQAAKAQAMYIRKHGKKAFLKVHDRLHQNCGFWKRAEQYTNIVDGGIVPRGARQ